MRIALLVVAALAAGPAAAFAHEIKLGKLEIIHPNTVEPADAGAKDAAVAMTIHNRAKVDDRIVGASSPVASKAELRGGAEGAPSHLAAIDIPAGGTVALSRKGPHVMLLGLKRRLTGYSTFPLRLVFEKSGKVDLEVMVEENDDAGIELAAGDGSPAALTATSKTGDLTIEAAWARATPEGAKVGAGYLKITNSGTAPDVLTGVSSPVAESIDIHEMTASADGVMRMRPLSGGLAIKPGEPVELKPGGLHLMLMGLKAPLKDGERFGATLTFKHAAAVEVEFAVAPVGAGAQPQPHQHAH